MSGAVSDRDGRPSPAGDSGAPALSVEHLSKVHDGDPCLHRNRLERSALVGREVRDDDPGRARIGQGPRPVAAVAAADQLVRVAHCHERNPRPCGGDPADEREAAVEGRTVGERTL